MKVSAKYINSKDKNNGNTKQTTAHKNTKLLEKIQEKPNSKHRS